MHDLIEEELVAFDALPTEEGIYDQRREIYDYFVRENPQPGTTKFDLPTSPASSERLTTSCATGASFDLYDTAPFFSSAVWAAAREVLRHGLRQTTKRSAYH